MIVTIEDSQNISRLIVKTLYRLSVKVGTTTKVIRELIDVFMTDSVNKNLTVEHLISEELESDHILHHYLCNAHTSKKFGKVLVSVLTSIEKEILLREK